MMRGEEVGKEGDHDSEVMFHVSTSPNKERRVFRSQFLPERELLVQVLQMHCQKSPREVSGGG